MANHRFEIDHSLDDEHYMLVFGSQAEPNLPHHSHVFALFARTSKNGSVANNEALETHVISWLPENGVVDPLALIPVPGRNFGLEETLRQARAVKATVSCWGPFHITKELYCMAVDQERRLNQKTIAYLMLDTPHRGNGASNCIHAVSDLDIRQGSLVTGLNYGNAAGLQVCEHLMPYITPARLDLNWLCARLNLDSSEIHFVKDQTLAIAMKDRIRLQRSVLRKSRLSPKLQAYVADYGESHQTAANQALHFAGIPLLMVSAVGLLARLPYPTPNAYSMLNPNAAWLFLIGVAIWYLFLDSKASVVLSLMFFTAYMIGASMPAAILAGGLGIGIIAHIIGHAVFEKRPPSLLKKPISLLVAPAWLLEQIGY
jgi:uncharacterized membrane protein YGL010W